MGEAEVKAFLTHLAVDRQLAPSTLAQALAALLFLYREVVGRPLAGVGPVPRARATRATPGRPDAGGGAPGDAGPYAAGRRGGLDCRYGGLDPLELACTGIRDLARHGSAGPIRVMPPPHLDSMYIQTHITRCGARGIPKRATPTIGIGASTSPLRR